MKSNETLFLSCKLRCIFVRIKIFATWMHKVKLDFFFNIGYFWISECNLAGFPMLKKLTKKYVEFLDLILGPCFCVETDQEIGEISCSRFLSIFQSEKHFRLFFFSDFLFVFFFARIRMKIYNLVVENLILLFFFAWSCCTVCFRFNN